MSPIILVTGATGNTGGHVVKQLAASGKAAVRALARNPDSDAAKELAKLASVTVVKGDFSDKESIKAALAGVQRAFLVSSAGEDSQSDVEIAFLEQAQAAGLEAVVRISTCDFLIGPEVHCVYAKAHWRIEEWITQHSAKVVDLQPNYFFSNLVMAAGEIKAAGRLTYPITKEQADNGKFAALDPRDVAGAAVAVLTADKPTLDKLLAVKRLQVHGPAEVTYTKCLEAISKATGKEVVLNSVPKEAWVDAMVGFGMSKYFAESFANTILSCADGWPTARPKISTTTPELAAIWAPKITLEDWAKDSAAAFA